MGFWFTRRVRERNGVGTFSRVRRGGVLLLGGVEGSGERGRGVALERVGGRRPGNTVQGSAGG